MASSRSFFLLIVALAGCAWQPHMMPAPVMFMDERLDFTPRLSAELRSTRLPVFYATTRAPASPGEAGHYLNRVGNGMTLGVADIRLGGPDWTWDQLLASDRTSSVAQPRPGAVIGVEELGRLAAGVESEEVGRRFVAAIDAQLARVKNREMVLYVHGYRVTFDDVSVQMGSFAHYLGHGAVITFQWPTGLNFWNYLTDCPRAESFIPDIERLLELLARSSAERINVLAYSCGSPLLAQALARLRARHPQEGRAELARRYRIGNVMFAGSDVDYRTFARQLVPPILDLAQQLIVYVSLNDRALSVSRLLAGASRLGSPDDTELLPGELERLAADPRLQAIDVSDVRGAQEMGGIKGHGYWYANSWVSADVTLSLRHPIPPAARCLVRTRGDPLTWRFPDDYPDCVAEGLMAALPETRRSPGKQRTAP